MSVSREDTLTSPAWEFYVLPCWNLLTAAWGSYAITMISEVVPAPKVYLFFALFNTISRTSGFTGPFICSAIISRANGNSRVAYWFLVGLGALGVFFACLVNVEQAKIDNAKCESGAGCRADPQSWSGRPRSSTLTASAPSRRSVSSWRLLL